MEAALQSRHKRPCCGLVMMKMVLSYNRIEADLQAKLSNGKNVETAPLQSNALLPPRQFADPASLLLFADAACH